MPVTFKDNSAQVLRDLDRLSRAALEAVGNQAVTHAKQTVTIAGRIASGDMVGKIFHRVVGDTCYVGTNTRYAIYHEMGTGIHIAGGRKTPWAYHGADGEWHWTRGVAPLHFIKNAAANHVAEYKAIIKRILSGG
jgi:hypothetical protein